MLYLYSSIKELCFYQSISIFFQFFIFNDVIYNPASKHISFNMNSLIIFIDREYLVCFAFNTQMTMIWSKCNRQSGMFEMLGYYIP